MCGSTPPFSAILKQGIKNDPINIKVYRIEVVNDFRGAYSFINYVNYGSLQVLDVCLVGSKTGYQKSTDSIQIYLNHNFHSKFTKKQSAYQTVKKLIEEAPIECLKDFTMYGETLLKELG